MRKAIKGIFSVLGKVFGAILSIALELAALYLLASILMDIFGSVMMFLLPIVILVVVVEVLCWLFMPA